MPQTYNARRNRLMRKQYNERLKLLITAINASAMAILVSVFIFPVVRMGDITAFTNLFSWLWLIVSVILHLYAQYLFGFLQ